jgi:hypothetical protein
MRMMLKAVMDTAAANAVIADGSISQVIGRLADQLHPEAAYFAGDDGQRCCFMVFDMVDAADLPSICEPLFMAANARITVTPCMNVEDMQKGLARFQEAAGAPAGNGTASRTSAGIG